MTVPTSLDAFQHECERFLSSSYERRTGADEPFLWGKGSDRTAIFEELEPEAERAAIAAVRAWRRALWAADLGWITGPVELGGRGLPASHQRTFDLRARCYVVPPSTKLTVSLGIVAPTILAHAGEVTRRELLPAMHAGEVIACQLFSEPDAGSDLASVATRATRDGDGWRITGQKVWTSGAHYSDVGEVLCRTADGPRYRNLSAFVLDMSAPGVQVRPLRQMTGGAAFNEVFLDDVFVPDTRRLGDVGDGWQVALTTLARERQALGGEGFGGTGVLSVERYRQLVRAFGRERDPLVRQAFADLVVHLRVAKYARARALDLLRAGLADGAEGPIGKAQLAANYSRVCDFVALVIGPRLVADTGEWGTYAWSDFLLGAPSMRIAGGTDEVLKNVVAERSLGLPRA